MKKNQKAKLTFIFIIAVIIISFLSIWLLNRSNHTAIEDLSKIKAEETFTQSEDEYIVYFWQSTCTYCKQIEQDVLSYSNSGELPIYIVDMQNTSNEDYWYDWEGHHKEYDQIIGKLENEKEVFKEGITLEQFQNDQEVAWSIAVNNEKDIIATHNTAYGNEEPETAKEIEITGTPTMIQVKNGMFESYAVGVDETLKLIDKQ
ncbi:thioredoxin fold domain-containing protein [Bacillus sp. B1-b2]|uniref:thioredoxin fold domain-containing protein n=1 Tax=Bacillus sp. B1-b2 TaxID=2653201 RepID=UPI001261C5E8|nr:thioredoxin fold domain-containing protein [Bacillus sp. B1-b2]KAB7667615.1 hypothetical protein F9279_15265 [Bacillus sp. B1-b2]